MRYQLVILATFHWLWGVRAQFGANGLDDKPNEIITNVGLNRAFCRLHSDCAVGENCQKVCFWHQPDDKLVGCKITCVRRREDFSIQITDPQTNEAIAGGRPEGYGNGRNQPTTVQGFFGNNNNRYVTTRPTSRNIGYATTTSGNGGRGIFGGYPSPTPRHGANIGGGRHGSNGSNRPSGHGSLLPSGPTGYPSPSGNGGFPSPSNGNGNHGHGGNGGYGTTRGTTRGQPQPSGRHGHGNNGGRGGYPAPSPPPTPAPAPSPGRGGYPSPGSNNGQGPSSGHGHNRGNGNGAGIFVPGFPIGGYGGPGQASNCPAAPICAHGCGTTIDKRNCQICHCLHKGPKSCTTDADCDSEGSQSCQYKTCRCTEGFRESRHNPNQCVPKPRRFSGVVSLNFPNLGGNIHPPQGQGQQGGSGYPSPGRSQGGQGGHGGRGGHGGQGGRGSGNGGQGGHGHGSSRGGYPSPGRTEDRSTSPSGPSQGSGGYPSPSSGGTRENVVGPRGHRNQGGYPSPASNRGGGTASRIHPPPRGDPYERTGGGAPQLGPPGGYQRQFSERQTEELFQPPIQPLIRDASGSAGFECANLTDCNLGLVCCEMNFCEDKTGFCNRGRFCLSSEKCAVMQQNKNL